MLENSEGRVAAAVIDSTPRVVFEHAGDEPHELASVAKIYILLAYLDQLAREGREPTASEVESMQAMIEVSDNVSATQMFRAVGNVDGVNAFLASHSLSPIEPAYDGSWGSMRATPLQVGELLVNLYSGRILDLPRTQLAFSLLSGVIEAQSWGVGAAQDGARVQDVYLKNGWLPADEGWIVNSVGLVASPDNTYVVVFLTDRQPGFEGAVSEIERAVDLIRTGLFTPATAGPSPTASPAVIGTPANTPAASSPATPSPPAETRTPVATATPALQGGRIQPPQPDR